MFRCFKYQRGRTLRYRKFIPRRNGGSINGRIFFARHRDSRDIGTTSGQPDANLENWRFCRDSGEMVVHSREDWNTQRTIVTSKGRIAPISRKITPESLRKSGSKECVEKWNVLPVIYLETCAHGARKLTSANVPRPEDGGNSNFEYFCEKNSIFHSFPATRSSYLAFLRSTRERPKRGSSVKLLNSSNTRG